MNRCLRRRKGREEEEEEKVDNYLICLNVYLEEIYSHWTILDEFEIQIEKTKQTNQKQFITSKKVYETRNVVIQYTAQP